MRLSCEPVCRPVSGVAGTGVDTVTIRLAVGGEIANLCSMKKTLFILLFGSAMTLRCVAETPAADDIAQCVQTTKVVFNHKNDRDPKILREYYAPQFRALIKKGAAGPAGEAPFLDADFLRLTQDLLPEIAKVGPGTVRDGHISVPVLLRYPRGVVETNTAVFERVGQRWMICDLVSRDGSLATDLANEFGTKK